MASSSHHESAADVARRRSGTAAGRMLQTQILPPQRKRNPRRTSLEIPERLRGDDEGPDDAPARPQRASGQYMQQSLLQVITAAARFDEGVTDSESEVESEDEPPLSAKRPTVKAEDERQEGKEHKGKHRRKISDNKLIRSLPRLKLRSTRERRERSQAVEDMMSSSQILPPRSAIPEESEETDDDQNISSPQAEAPFMSRMLKAEARADLDLSDVGLETPKARTSILDSGRKVKVPVTLSQRLMEIFELDQPEEVIAEYPCWLLQNVLLQGYLYITQRHICFYAYLPMKSNVVTKSGYLSKRGLRNPKYHRQFFRLKGDTLTYHADAAQLHFQIGHVDLRYAISADLADAEKVKDTTAFTITTNQRQYQFKADSATSAKEWVRQLQKVIFRARNDGDSIKIALPIENVMDVEKHPILDFADTVKIQVIDNNETYTVDDYFFSFFSFAQDALNILRIMIHDNALHANLDAERQGALSEKEHGTLLNEKLQRASEGRLSTALTPAILHDHVRATLTPVSPISRASSKPRLSSDSRRSSFEVGRHSIDALPEHSRASLDRGRRSFSPRRNDSTKKEPRREARSPLSAKPIESSDSAFQSMDQDTDSSAAIQSIDESNVSASQILNRSDVFQTPTISLPQRASIGTPLDPAERASQDTARASRPHPLRIPRAHSEQTADQRHSMEVSEAKEDEDPHSGKAESSSAIRGLFRASAYPLQRAYGAAGYLTSGTKHMGNLLASESMGYYEKVSGMWAGGRKHYKTQDGLSPEDTVHEAEDDEDALNHGERFRAHFGLPDSEELHAAFFCYYFRLLPLYGKIYISNRHFCFRSLLPGVKEKLVLPLKDIENIDKEKGFRLRFSGLVVTIRGSEELFFEFRPTELRDDCAITLLRSLDTIRYMNDDTALNAEEQHDAEAAEAAAAEHRILQEAHEDISRGSSFPRTLSGSERSGPAMIFDDPEASIINIKPSSAMRITCLTIGSRGDVQPYIALCKRLLAEGHQPRIATHPEFEAWIRKHGIDFAPVAGEPAELMRVCTDNGMFTLAFFREASSKFRGWLDELLTTSWKACQDSDLLIESPSAMAGIHIAEALEIPYFRAFSMPWTRTRVYPHAFAVPEHKMGGAYNRMTYVMFETVFWKAIASQVNRWRKKELHLPSTSLDKMQPNKVPFLYSLSPSVVSPPRDFGSWIKITGYWFLDEGQEWTPPQELVAFIKKARDDNKRLVYIGFGSIVINDAAEMTRKVVEAVLKADVRCILAKGWSDRHTGKDASKAEIPLPPEIHKITSAPHDWLFGQIDAAMHHGGAGTTGASLRAGIPTIIRPFFGDQFFFGTRVEDLGVGIYVRKDGVNSFARALWQASRDGRMANRARVMGEAIRSEDGVGEAVKFIYRTLDYSRSLIKHRIKHADDAADDTEESWTFIGDDSDADLPKRLPDLDTEASKETARKAFAGLQI